MEDDQDGLRQNVRAVRSVRAICVMTQALLENIFAPEKLDAVFERAAEQQYHRELLFSPWST